MAISINTAPIEPLGDNIIDPVKVKAKINEIVKAHPNVRLSDEPYEDHSDWMYYFALSGWVGGKYFSIYLNRTLDGVREHSITSHVTEDIQTVREVFAPLGVKPDNS